MRGSWGSIVNETAGQGQSQQDTDVSSQGSARAGAALGWRYRLLEDHGGGPHTASQIDSFSERSTLNILNKGVQNLSTDKYRPLLIGDPHTLYEEYLV